MTGRDEPPGGGKLRRLAEQRLAEREASAPHEERADPHRLIHELEVHQIELEMQNEELAASRHEAEVSLRRYTELFDFSPIAYFVLAGDGTIRELNLAAAGLLGIERPHLVGRRLGVFVEPAGRHTFADYLDAVRADEGVRTGDCELVLLVGAEHRDVHVTATRIHGTADTLVTLLAAVQDVTARKRAEAALRMEHDERERLLVQTRRDLNGMNQLHRVSARFLPANSALEPVFGEIVEAAISIADTDFGSLLIVEPASGRLKVVAQHGFGASWVELWEGEAGHGARLGRVEYPEQVIVEDVERNLIYAGTPELEVMRAAGVRAVVSTPLRSRSGTSLGMLSVHFKTPHRPDERALRLLDLLARQAADLLDRARADAAQRVLRGRFEALDHLSSTLGERMARAPAPLPDAEFFQDIVDVARVACDAEYAALGIGNDPARPFDDWVHSGVSTDVAMAIGRPPGPRGLLGEVIRSGRSMRCPDVRQHPAFRGFPAHHPEMRSFIGVVIPDGGRPIGHLYLANKRSAAEFSDDDQKTLELLAQRAGTVLEIARLTAALQAAVRVRDNMLAVVSHDLRNPLSSITLATQLIDLQGVPRVPANGPDPLAMIARAVQRAHRLIDDLLRAASIESGTLVVEMNRESIADIVEQVLAAIQPIAAGRSVHLERDVPALPPARCDRDRIVQVLSNLLDNALKFVPDGGTIQIRAHDRAGAIEIAVSDDGPGIHPDELPHLFDRYWKGKAKGRHGVGLGLYIVKGIVESHGGRVWVDSQLGRGTTFTFTIPIADEVEPSSDVPGP